VEFVGNPPFLKVWVTCVQSVGNMLFVANALCMGYPCPVRVIHKSIGLFLLHFTERHGGRSLHLHIFLNMDFQYSVFIDHLTLPVCVFLMVFTIK